MTPTTPERIAFIGGGHLAASLIGGLLAAGHPASSITVATRTEATATSLRKRFGIEAGSDRQKTVDGAAIVVLAVKPQQMAEALAGLRVSSSSTVISVAAGLRVATLRALLTRGGFDGAIVRSMPNTPSLLRQGIAGAYAPAGTDARARRHATQLLEAVGEVCWVDDEALIDAVTAISGSGPAYFFHYTEALRDAGAALGLDATVAARLALRTFTGAAAMAATGPDVAELRAQVTSKGGTTEAALATLESAGLRRTVAAAVCAAADRARQRGDELAQALETP